MGEAILVRKITEVVQNIKKQHKKIVLVGGCFDILHPGHVIFLEKAKKVGDILFVLLESDEKVKKIKGANRPIHNQKMRAKVLSVLCCVDYIVMLPFLKSDTDYDKLKNIFQSFVKPGNFYYFTNFLYRWRTGIKAHEKKVEILHDLLIKEDFRKVLIFGRTKRGVQKLTDELTSRGFKAGAIHGNKRQSHRQKTLDQFRKNQISILLATDLASRGLDIENVSHVINYDMPASYNDYIHRIGRTGRADKKGIALTFVG